MARSLRSFLLTLSLLAAFGAQAETPRAPENAEFERVLGGGVPAIQRLSQEDLKRLYLHCSAAAESGRMGSGEIAMCSIAYEELLGASFGGDFRSLLEWSRTQKSTLLRDGAITGRKS